MDRNRLGRRELLVGGIGLALAPRAGLAAPGRLTFQVFRNGTRVGEHVIVFGGDEANRTVATDVTMTVKLGPVPVFRYRHTATEHWQNGRFVSLETLTDSNGKVQKTAARTVGSHVQIDGPAGPVRGPADAAPLSHWNQASFGRPLFNPQEGRMLKVRCTQVAPGHWSVRGDAEIDDFYDAAGAWAALKGKLEDGSRMEYRRV